MKAVHFDKEGCEKLHVRGEDQLLSFKGVLALRIDAVISGANGYVATGLVPAGEYWVVTTCVALNNTTAPTLMTFAVIHDGTTVEFHAEERAFGIAERGVWSGHTYLDVGDSIRAYFKGGEVGDSCLLRITGYKMTVEV